MHLLRISLAGTLLTAACAIADEPRTVMAPVKLWNGKDLAGLTPWIKETGGDDTRRVFRVTEDLLHVTGEGFGYLASEHAYRDYRAVLEFKWGKRTDGGKYVRNSGLLVNAVTPHGGTGTWPPCIEVQLAQGCCGDLITIGGKNALRNPVASEITSDIAIGPDKRPRWSVGGDKKVFTKQQLWWNRHDPTFEELLDTRGKDDVESPLGEWTRVEVEARDDTLTVFVNGHKVNHAYHVRPAAGKVLLQCEGFELWVRTWELQPLAP